MAHNTHGTAQSCCNVCLIFAIDKPFYPIFSLERKHSGNTVNRQRHRNHIIDIVCTIYIAEGNIRAKILRRSGSDAWRMLNPKFRSILLSKRSHILAIRCIMFLLPPINLQITNPCFSKSREPVCPELIWRHCALGILIGCDPQAQTFPSIRSSAEPLMEGNLVVSTSSRP